MQAKQLLFSAGDCAVCSDSGALLFVADKEGGCVLIYCPACGCAWLAPTEAADGIVTRGIEEIAPHGIRVASRSEIDAAGFGASIVGTESWSLP